MNLLRKIFFYIFLAVFLGVCPLLVLYSLGYFLKPSQAPQIVKMGVIHLVSVPEGAEIWVDGKLHSKKTPTVISDLTAGDYDIQVSLSGHRPWQQRVTIQPGRAESFSKILLLPEKLKAELLFDKASTAIYPLGRDGILLRRGNTLGDLYLYDLAARIAEPLFTNNPQVDLTLPIQKVHQVPESEAILVRSGTLIGRSRYDWVRMSNRGAEPADLSGLFIQEPKRLLWDTAAPSDIFNFYDGFLDRIDISSRAVVPRQFSGMRAYGLLRSFFGPKFYGLSREGEFFRCNTECSKKETLRLDPVFFDALLGRDRFFEIKVLEEDLLFFLSDEGKLVGNRLPYLFAEKGVQDLVYDRGDSRDILVLAGHRLGILSFSGKQRKKEVFETMPKIEWVYDGKDSVEQAFWVYEGSHFIFREGEQVWIAESGNAESSAVRPILKVRQGSGIFYDEKSGQLYYLGSEDGFLYSSEILPRNLLSILTLPEFSTGEKETAPAS
ncbi:MAG: PEGA domain-containing protein [Candidatus Omnitrophota bacterium]